MNELKTCPFCGADPKIDRERNYYGVVILCDNKDCSVKPWIEGHYDKAVVGWNTRADSFQKIENPMDKDKISKYGHPKASKVSPLFYEKTNDAMH